MKKLKILLVEDDILYLRLLEETLKVNGFTNILSSDSISQALATAKKEMPNLIIIDINLSDGNGMDLLKKIRKDVSLSNIPVIVLTCKSEFVSKKSFFEAGADAYLVKGIDPQELILWIESFYRRKIAISENLKIKDGNFEIDGNLRLVFWHEKNIILTKREFDLLYNLVLMSPKIFSRQEILSDIWKTVAVENLVDIHIHNLRNKLPKEVSERIETYRGLGFRYVFSNLKSLGKN